MSLIGLMAAALGVIAAILIMHPRYEDGLVGRVALASVVFGCLIVVMIEVATESHYTAPAELVVLLAGQCAFMSRHLYRFIAWTRRRAIRMDD